MTSTATSSTPAANPFQPAWTATSVPPAPHSTTGAQSPAQIASWVSAAVVTITSAAGSSPARAGTRAPSRSASNTCTPCSSSTIVQAAPVSLRWCSICDRRPHPSDGRMSPSAASVATTVSTCRPTEPRKSSSTVTIGLLFQERRNVEIVVVVGIERIGFDVVAEQLGDPRRRTGARHVAGTRATRPAGRRRGRSRRR